MCLIKQNSQTNNPTFSNEFPLVSELNSLQIVRIQNLDNNNCENPASNQAICTTKPRHVLFSNFQVEIFI